MSKFNELSELQQVAAILSDNAYDCKVEKIALGHEVLTFTNLDGEEIIIWSHNVDLNRTAEIEDSDVLIEVTNLDVNEILNVLTSRLGIILH